MKSQSAFHFPAFRKSPLRSCISLIIMSLCLFLSACSAKPAEKSEIDTVFEAINHLCEAKTLQAKGSFDVTTFGKGDIELWIENENQFQIAAQSNPGTKSAIEFYLKDGKTYLNYHGEKTQSVAANIGIDSDEPMKFYNPLLDLSQEERDEIFTNVTKDGNTYSMEIDKYKLAQLLDNFGAVGVRQAVLSVTIENDEIRNISMNADIRSALMPASNIKMKFSLDVISMNQKLDMPWPSDLDSYKKTEEEDD